MNKTDWIVLKFGGTSVSCKSSWLTIKNIINQRRAKGNKILIICSAISQISNQLEKLITDALSNNYDESLEGITKRHLKLIKELELEPGISTIASELELLKRTIFGINLIQEVSPSSRARILALGEIMLTKLSSAWLQSQSINNIWIDARSYLKAKFNTQNRELHYLSNYCDSSFDQNVLKRIESLNSDVVISQGYIASNNYNETVLLGRGGSDISASLFASKIGAKHVEIWTDVPGMFSSNPHKVPTARLIKKLDYEEAQELATSGAKVLHPLCIEPVKKPKIPLKICWTQKPDFNGTIIHHSNKESSNRVKAILSKNDTYLVTMESLGMWHEVGFLANLFNVFKDHGFSIDLVATAQSHVSVTLDQMSQVIDKKAIERLMTDLSNFCNAEWHGPVSSVSLVGKNIRSILHTLGPAFEAFEEKNCHLVSQASNNLNLSFVVDEAHAHKLIENLHCQFFSDDNYTKDFGPMWCEIFNSKKEKLKNFIKKDWWEDKKEDLLTNAKKHTASYVYNIETISKRISDLKSLQDIKRINYAIKANPNIDIIKFIEKRGLCFDCVSIEEVNLILKTCPNIDPKRILFTPNFISKSEFSTALDKKVLLTLDNTHPLKYYPELFSKQEIFLRIDPDLIRGHHKHVQTSGQQSKFGIVASEIEGILPQIKEYKINVIGLHAHVGSGIKDGDFWFQTAMALHKIAKYFTTVKHLDLGGGLGVIEKLGESKVNLEHINEKLSSFNKAFPQYELWIEPGRFLVSESGVLLTTVTQLKTKGKRNYLGVNVGMNALIRPSLYGAYHRIINLTRLHAESDQIYDVVGPICESGDVLGHNRLLPKSEEGDVLCIANCGAYGASMASSYNLREKPVEIIIDYT